MIELKLLAPDDREQFIKDNQEAFYYGALEEFGMHNNHFENKAYGLGGLYVGLSVCCCIFGILLGKKLATALG